MNPRVVSALLAVAATERRLSRRALDLYVYVIQSADENMVWESSQKRAAAALELDQGDVSRLLAHLVKEQYLIPDRPTGHARRYRLTLRSERTCHLPPYSRTA